MGQEPKEVKVNGVLALEKPVKEFRSLEALGNGREILKRDNASAARLSTPGTWIALNEKL